jgi:hypothetical protein
MHHVRHHRGVEVECAAVGEFGIVAVDDRLPVVRAVLHDPVAGDVAPAQCPGSGQPDRALAPFGPRVQHSSDAFGARSDGMTDTSPRACALSSTGAIPP